ncbi:prepilin-type N-terminal cleavage/methylation domain-containing protein [Patescibacteria group bacterium]|nr:prepilin-type N-terminal cleavage/methylation domain-containing protein [Patescibacteria group bacterium]
MSTTKIVSKLGFTLIELMVVVSIIGVLMAAGILAFSNAQQNARDAKRRADVDALSKALEQYYGNNAAYPASASSLTTFFPSGSLPTDPQGSNYDIKLAAGGTAYCVCATLEKPGRGNASAVGNSSGVCSYAAGGNYFCASQRQ